jgi:hypothetical protein
MHPGAPNPARPSRPTATFVPGWPGQPSAASGITCIVAEAIGGMADQWRTNEHERSHHRTRLERGTMAENWLTGTIARAILR